MTWEWQTIKERTRSGYAKTAQVLVFLGFCFYLFACVVAGRPVGPKSYVDFAYHCIKWEPPITHAASANAQ